MSDPRHLKPAPLADKLRPALAPERVELVWRRIAEARQETKRGVRAPKLWIGVAGTLAAAAAVLFMLRGVEGPGTEPAYGENAAAPAAIAPLTLSGGTALTEITTLDASRTIALSDGSQIDVAAGSRLKPLDVSERSVLLLLVQGKARFTVKPGGPRRWVVEAGSASVEVVGTRFTVDRAQGAVRVDVEEGKVLVRGAGIEDGVTRLTAGESLSVPSHAEAASAPEPAPAPAPQLAAAEKAERARAVQTKKAAAPSRPRPRESVEAAAKPTAVKELLPLGALDADALLALADQARMSRDFRGAIGALGRVLQEHATDPRARLAAFTIGRIREEELHDLAGAVLAYEDALRRGLSGSLAEDCMIRLLRVRGAQVDAGAVEPARMHAAARRYLARYPRGRYASEAKRMLEGASEGASTRPSLEQQLLDTPAPTGK